MLKAAIDPDVRLRRGSGHVEANIGNATAMMSASRGSYYAVSGVAERIWQLLEVPATPREISAALQREYAIDPERCDAEVAAFLADLLAEGLIEDPGK